MVATMTSTYRIAEVAERSGFTAATLRYYDDIGLLAPAGRTDSGYRVYDDASLERLRFISRAKRLGCTLDEIAELVTVWDGGRCRPVQHRLRATVEAKVAETRARVAELTALASELERAADALTAHRPDGPCDDTCGCSSDPPAGAPPTDPVSGAADAPGAVAADTGSGSAHAAIACTLGPGGVAARVGEWRALLADRSDAPLRVTARRPLDDGVRLELGPGADVAEIARLAAAEQGCCPFFRFAVVFDAGGVALDVHAPPEAAGLVAALFGAPPRPSAAVARS